MTTIKLRQHQVLIKKKLMSLFKKGYKKILIQMPTGAGKTITAVDILNGITNYKCGFFCHRINLVTQGNKTLRKYGINSGTILSGKPFRADKQVYVVSIDTIINSSDAPDFDLIIWDECHHIAADTWGKLYTKFNKAYHIGLSATPNRTDGLDLNKFFDKIITLDEVLEELKVKPIHQSSVRWLINNNYLSDYNIYGIPETQDANRNYLNNWFKYANNMLTIGFAKNIKHAEKLADYFNDNGVSAASLSSETDESLRAAVLQKFAEGKIKVIFNVNLFSEGFDISATTGVDITIKCVILTTFTSSLPTYLQRCGRALRASDTKSVILDFAGNVIEHGVPCAKNEWTLDGYIKASEKTVPVKQCLSCYAFNAPTVSKCVVCGLEFPIKGSRDNEIIIESNNHNILKKIDIEENSNISKNYRIKLAKEKNAIAIHKKYKKKIPEANAIAKRNYERRIYIDLYHKICKKNKIRPIGDDVYLLNIDQISYLIENSK